jgi:serine/threonine protein phosphatase PrpC
MFPFRRRRKNKAPRDGNPSAPLEPPTVPLRARAPEPIAVGARGSASNKPRSTGVVGPTIIPQITVGSPSPAVEPSAIATGYCSLPFRPDVVIDGWSTDTMTVRGVSQRGHLHRYNGAPRQDDFALHLLPDGRVIVLVADGVSGAPQSHIGASTVTKQAAEWLHSYLSHDTASTDWLALLKSAAWALTERAQTLLGLDAPDPVRAEEQLATTLACAVVEPTGVHTLRAYVVGAGDSVAWLLSAGRFVEVLAGKAVPANGVASSAVVGLPRVPTEVTPMIVDIAENDVLLIATDGIGDPLGAGQGAVGDLFREVLTKPSAPSLIEFAHAVDFSRETFDDDRTLVAVWPRRRLSDATMAQARGPSAVEGLR